MRPTRLTATALGIAALCAVGSIGGCGSDDPSSGGDEAKSAAEASDRPGPVATTCPSPEQLNVEGTFRFRRMKPPRGEKPNIRLSCAYRSGPARSNGREPASLVNFVITDLGDDLDRIFDEIVELEKCEPDPVRPANCSLDDMDDAYSRSEVSDDSLETIRVGKPLGETRAGQFAPNPANRVGSFTALFKNGNLVCATTEDQNTSDSEDPQALEDLGENTIVLVKEACGRARREP